MSAPQPHVVIGFDGSEAAEHAIGAAARLLPSARATVVVVRESWLPLEQASAARIALPDSVIGPATRALDEELAASARQLLERGRELVASAGLEAGAEIEVARSPWRGLAAAAARLGATAIVCGASGRGGIPRAVLGTTTDALLHHAPAPVLVVPEGEAAEGPVVIGYDGSAEAREAVRDAASLFGGRPALVVHAGPPPSGARSRPEALETPVDEVQQLAKSLDDMYAGDAEDWRRRAPRWRGSAGSRRSRGRGIRPRRLARDRRARRRARRRRDRRRLPRPRLARRGRARLGLVRPRAQRAPAGARLRAGLRRPRDAPADRAVSARRRRRLASEVGAGRHGSRSCSGGRGRA